MTAIWRFLKFRTSLILVGALLFGCMQSDYTKMVKAELAKGIRKDSVLFGINFGDTRNEFYGKCYDLNKKQLVTQGPNNSSVQYIFTDSVVHREPAKIRLLFFPNFDSEEKISDVNLEFSYSGWAPWNRQYQSDSLEIKVKQLLMIWFKGNEFVTAHVDEKDIPVKVDGNRRMLVYITDTQNVVIKVQDILHPKFKHSISSGEADSKKN